MQIVLLTLGPIDTMLRMGEDTSITSGPLMQIQIMYTRMVCYSGCMSKDTILKVGEDTSNVTKYRA